MPTFCRQLHAITFDVELATSGLPDFCPVWRLGLKAGIASSGQVIKLLHFRHIDRTQIGSMVAQARRETPKVKCILLIEDSLFLRKTTERILCRAGYSVVTAADGEEALSLAIAIRPDVILLDMLLPKVSGLDVLRALRQNPIMKGTPIIVMSGLSQANEKKLREEGADAYCQKSALDLDVDDTSIVQMVQKMLTKAYERNDGTVAHI